MNDLAGYVTDVPYVYGFKPMLAPAWLDLVAVLGGVSPPARNTGFAWCDLGCGQGVTAAILAATHPTGTFHGIDAMPAHIEHAARLAGARFAAAAALVGRLAEAGAPSLAASFVANELRRRSGDYRPGYLVHEFMHAGWQPLYVTELRRDLKEIGLVPVGSALLGGHFDGWVLGRRARGLVAGIADPDRREMVRDFCIDQRFRCDVFARDASPLTASKQRERLMSSGLALVRPPAAITYEMPTPAGRVR